MNFNNSSITFRVETTLAPGSDETPYEEKNARLNELLASSKDELIIEDVENDENGRVKRWFGYKYVATTTLTTYTFFSTTVTKTVVLLTAATTSALTCLPYGFTVCWWLLQLALFLFALTVYKLILFHAFALLWEKQTIHIYCSNYMIHTMKSHYI